MKANLYKGVWLSFLDWNLFNMKSREGFCTSARRLYEKCCTLEINRVILHVRPFSDAIYPSEFYPWSHILLGEQGLAPNFDPLQLLTEISIEYGIGIDAWINPYRVFMNHLLPRKLFSKNPAVRYPHLTKDCNGGSFFNPALPEVIELVVNGVKEVVKNYNISAIHFDDYFYPTTQIDFDIDIYHKQQTNLSLEDWRRDNVNKLVRQTYHSIKSINPEIQFGISPQGNNQQNYNVQFCDTGLWLREAGYIDYLMPQIYWGFNFATEQGLIDCSFMQCINNWLSLPRNNTTQLMFGLGAYRVGIGDGSLHQSEEWFSGSNLRRMVDHISTIPCDGYAFFRAGNLFSDNLTPLMQQELQNLTQK